jgi:DNA repair exonuclease SbcCD nuclease subunit
MFFDKLAELNIKVHMIAGNHDTYFKNTNDVNSVDLLLNEYTNLDIIDSPKTIYVDNTPICMVPWIAPDNYQQSIDEINNTEAIVCMGHFEIAGFAMQRGFPSHDGLNRDIFKRVDMVFSGHYHHRHHQDNIWYLGNPYELTWADCEDTRGFHFFDTDK